MSTTVLTREALMANFRRGTESAAAAEQPQIERLTRSSTANRYEGECVSCHQTVRPGEGTAKRQGQRWVVQHNECPMIEVRSLPKVQSSTGQVFTGILLPGIYTITDNLGVHETYRVRVQASDDDFAPGETVIEFLSGPDNMHDYTPFAFIKGSGLVVWKRFRAESREGYLYTHQVRGALALLRDPSRAQVARTCIRCNALLTTPESIEVGMGPTCRDKGW